MCWLQQQLKLPWWQALIIPTEAGCGIWVGYPKGPEVICPVFITADWSHPRPGKWLLALTRAGRATKEPVIWEQMEPRTRRWASSGSAGHRIIGFWGLPGLVSNPEPDTSFVSLAKWLNLSESPLLWGIVSDTALSAVQVHHDSFNHHHNPVVQVSNSFQITQLASSRDLNPESLFSATRLRPMTILCLPEQEYHGS